MVVAAGITTVVAVVEREHLAQMDSPAWEMVLVVPEGMELHPLSLVHPLPTLVVVGLDILSAELAVLEGAVTQQHCLQLLELLELQTLVVVAVLVVTTVLMVLAAPAAQA